LTHKFRCALFTSGTDILPNHLIESDSQLPDGRLARAAHKALKQHSIVSDADVVAICSLPDTERRLEPNEDIVKQGDKPKVSAVVVRGTVARYHTLQTGKRQYLSLHIAGDMPDSQTLFLEYMDHSVCAIDKAVVALIPHASLLKVFKQRPSAPVCCLRLRYGDRL
jgi:CRP-like cAMP-binding protein